MKLKFLTIALLGLTLATNGQTPSVEQSIWQIQGGLIGVWLNNETKLTNSLAIRSELGLGGGWKSYNDDFAYIITPVIRVEPRWYYNFGNRINKSRRIDNNSGNYLGVKTSFHPDLFVISNKENVTVFNQITIVPVWGIRRNMGKHFNYEAGIGIGGHYVLPNEKYYIDGEGEWTAALDVNLRIGYTF